MTTHAQEAPERQVAENIATTLHRAGMKYAALATATGIAPQTMSRRVKGQQPWLLWEVQVIADFLALTLTEITTDLPPRDEWQVRWNQLCACRDSNPKPSDLYLIVNHGLTVESRTAPARPSLRAVPSRAVLTAVAS